MSETKKGNHYTKAQMAYEKGYKPISKWTKQEIIERLKNHNVAAEIISVAEKYNTEILKKFFLEYKGNYRIRLKGTNFYNIRTEYPDVKSLVEELNKAKEENQRTHIPKKHRTLPVNKQLKFVRFVYPVNSYDYYSGMWEMNLIESYGVFNGIWIFMPDKHKKRITSKNVKIEEIIKIYDETMGLKDAIEDMIEYIKNNEAKKEQISYVLYYLLQRWLYLEKRDRQKWIEQNTPIWQQKISSYQNYYKEIDKILSQYVPKKIEIAQNAICIDTEMTGLNMKKKSLSLKDYINNREIQDEILQISIIDYDGNILMNEYCKPQWHDSWDTSIHHITPEMVANAPSFLELMPKILDILSSAETFIGYNNKADRNMLVASGIPFKFFIYVKDDDVQKRYAVIANDWSEYFHAYKLKKLTECARYCHYKDYKPHDSLEDAKATLFCLKRIKIEEQKTIERLKRKQELIHKQERLKEMLSQNLTYKSIIQLKDTNNHIKRFLVRKRTEKKYPYYVENGKEMAKKINVKYYNKNNINNCEITLCYPLCKTPIDEGNIYNIKELQMKLDNLEYIINDENDK